jgi:hypothetical protein
MSTVGRHLPLRVRVVLQGDPYTGHVGAIQRIIVDDDHGLVYLVRFCGDRDHYPHHTAYYLRDELTVDV